LTRRSSAAALWRDRFAGDAGIVGRTLALDGRKAEIVGVLPGGFFFPDTDARLWIPAPCGLDGFDARGAMVLNAVGRLKPGASVAEAEADLDVINARIAEQTGQDGPRPSTGVFPLRQILIGKYEQALWMLLAGVALVLLIACANVIHLQLARGIDREAELATRLAIGASRGRLMRQLLTESVVLSVLAGALGLLLAWAGISAIRVLAITDIPRMDLARLDLRLVAFIAGISMVSAWLSGLWPAWKTSRVRGLGALQVGAISTPGRHQSQARDMLAMTEIAIAITLIVASGLVVRSFVHLSQSDWGFEPDNLLLVSVKAPAQIARDRVRRAEFRDIVSGRIRRLAGVEHVSIGGVAPIRWGGWAPRPLSVDGLVRSSTAGVWAIGESYLQAVGVRILEGRVFDARDAAGAHSVVVSRSLARELWPGVTPVGRTLQILEARRDLPKPDPLALARLQMSGRLYQEWFQPLDGAAWEVIGVVADVRMFGLDVEGNPALYLDERQLPATWPYLRQDLQVLIRTTGRPTALVPSLKGEILDAYPDVAFTETVPMSELVSRSIGGRGSNKLMLVVSSTFGLLALGFASLGIYGIVAHGVSQRLRELGVRIALGATPMDVTRIVLGYAVRLLAFGTALGITIAWALTRHMEGLLFRVTPTDLVTYAASIGVLAVVALLACSIPLARALRLDVAVLFRN
jgi:putative ABC transport system permease protein